MELPGFSSLLSSQLKRYDNSYRSFTGQQERNAYQVQTSGMKKRFSHANLSKALNENEFLAKTPMEIRQEFRKVPNPPAKDIHAAR